MKKIVMMVIGFFVALFVLISVFDSYTVVNSGNRGLKFTFGELSNTELEEGLHFKVPFAQKIKEVTIQPIGQEITIPVGQDGAITKDNQTVGTTVTVFYKYNIGKISDIYREYGMTQIENITFKTVLESFKKVIGTYTIFEIANNQQDIITKMIESVKAESAKYPITITDVKITNFDWSDKFDAQIEATMARAQKVKQKEQELLVTENEANKRVKEAEATKQSMIKEAEGEYESAKIRAQAKIVEGEGIRKYNESIAKNLNVEIKLKELEIQKIQAERWNGTRVPTYWYAPIPIQKLQNSVAE